MALNLMPLFRNGEWLALGICFVVYAIIFIVWIILAVWVYKDAKKRGENAVLWLLVVLLTGIIGLIVYLIVRKGERKEEQPPPPPPPPPS